MKRAETLVASLTLLAACATSLFGQLDRGALTGIVQDPSAPPSQAPR